MKTLFKKDRQSNLISFNVTSITALLATFTLSPLSLIIPKKQARIVVIGRDKGLFLDNTKHFYLFLFHSATPEPDVVFLTEDQRTYEDLKNHSLPVIKHPSLKSFVYLLTASFIVIDSVEWLGKGKYQLGFSSKILQLWHGVPLKQIELPLFRKGLKNKKMLLRTMLQLQKKLTGRYTKYEFIASTSSYISDKAFNEAFNAKKIITTGYPRNDVIFSNLNTASNDSILINTDQDTINLIKSAKDGGEKLILYAPTFRKIADCPIMSGVIDFEELNDFLKINKILFILKLHPILTHHSFPANLDKIIKYNSADDIYPVLSLFDMLITDYSSIYFDFLLLNRPIVFFPFDYETYVEDDRELLFDYFDMTPGPICMNQKELQQALVEPETSFYKNQREELTKLIFEKQDADASKRLWDILKNTQTNLS